jgi:hypothetical protein
VVCSLIMSFQVYVFSQWLDERRSPMSVHQLWYSVLNILSFAPVIAFFSCLSVKTQGITKSWIYPVCLMCIILLTVFLWLLCFQLCKHSLAFLSEMWLKNCSVYSFIVYYFFSMLLIKNLNYRTR